MACEGVCAFVREWCVCIYVGWTWLRCIQQYFAGMLADELFHARKPAVHQLTEYTSFGLRKAVHLVVCAAHDFVEGCQGDEPAGLLAFKRGVQQSQLPLTACPVAHNPQFCQCVLLYLLGGHI
jgi:hypothetical protein